MSVYNEEARIADILRHAVQWADEVLILDKQSTDRTRSICGEYGLKVRVVEIPFSPQGHDDMISACRLATHDWIWVGTASEIPTRRLVAEAQRIVAEQPDLDLIYVPRKVYSFGVFTTESPWGIPYYPFLINRRRTVITNTIHQNFRAQNQSNTSKIPYSEDCCVHHYTHATAKSYVAAMAQYFEAESLRPNLGEVIQDALEQLERRRDLRSLVGQEAFGFECAWRLYWIGTALSAWDKARAVDAPKIYRAERAALLKREWPISPLASSDSQPAPQPRVTSDLGLFDLSGVAGQDVTSEEQMLLTIRGRPLTRLVRTLYQVGAHRFQEKKLLFELFPNLERVILFEPLPELFTLLKAQEAHDPRITVLPYAIADQNGEAVFHVTSNDAASSSLLPFGKHAQLFPEVQTTKDITVQTRTLATAIEQHQLPPPDFLFLDVQGAEFQILASLSPALRARLRLIYTEASTEEVYRGSQTLDEIKRLLTPHFFFLGYCPLTSEVSTHGNALFVQVEQLWLMLPTQSAAPPTPTAPTTSAGTLAKVFRAIFSRKLRRSIRKRLATLSQSLTD